MKSICHVSSAHPRYDTRIYQRMCKYLAHNNYTVSLVVADELMNEKKNDVEIISVGKPRNRLIRIFSSSFKVIKKALSLNAEIYHLHDPELILTIPLLKIKGKKVIFDFHEDYAEQIQVKEYSNKFFLKIFSFAFSLLERLFIPHIDGVISATPYIDKKYKKFHSNTIDINNFPEKNLLSLTDFVPERRNNICYVGAISKERGIIEMLSVINELDNQVQLELAGEFSDQEIKQQALSHPGWAKVIYHGKIPYEEVQKILNRSRVGMVILHPIKNYIYSQPTKLLEYMAAGLTVVASNFPFMRRIIEKNSIGYLVDPFDIRDIRNILEETLNKKEFDIELSRKSRDLIRNKYNWEIELKKLMYFYDDIISK